MDKRLHKKPSSTLTYRHYLYHFKWPLLAFLFLLIFISLIQNHLSTNIFASDQWKGIFMQDILSKDVIYPTDGIEGRDSHSNISLYFIKKDQLKAIDDARAIERHEKVIRPLEININSSGNSYLILEFTKVFGQPRFCSHTKDQIFGKTCPYTNCDYTCDLNLEKEADVLLMHKRDLNRNQLELMRRDPNQIWLLWHDESNENSPEINKYKFNWTITYRISAEASLSAYGITVVKEKPWSKQAFQVWIEQEFNKRQNQAVWFVSNCAPQKRLKLFSSLREYYPIVAFGKCILPNQTSSLHAHLHSNTKCDRQSSCEKLYLSTSKFYLAFESQTCTDYITEKFWRTLAAGAIPIVSGPERSNFQRIAPPHSFIHVDDYQNERELAMMLSRISTDRTLFEQYHQWRRFYDVLYEAKDVDPYRFCELCYRLNSNQQRIWYEDINQWFLDQCGK